MHAATAQADSHVSHQRNEFYDLQHWRLVAACGAHRRRLLASAPVPRFEDDPKQADLQASLLLGLLRIWVSLNGEGGCLGHLTFITILRAVSSSYTALLYMCVRIFPCSLSACENGNIIKKK